MAILGCVSVGRGGNPVESVVLSVSQLTEPSASELWGPRNCTTAAPPTVVVWATWSLPPSGPSRWRAGKHPRPQGPDSLLF